MTEPETCDAPSCRAPAAAGWTREATRRELEELVADPLVAAATEADLLPGAAPALVPVRACSAHALPAELAALVHAPLCSAPPRDPRCPACSPAPSPAGP